MPPESSTSASSLSSSLTASSCWVHRRYQHDSRLRVAERYRRCVPLSPGHHDNDDEDDDENNEMDQGRRVRSLLRRLSSSSSNHHHRQKNTSCTLIVPQAIVLRKYLPLILRLVVGMAPPQESSASSSLSAGHTSYRWIVLESCVDYMDWRNQVGAEKAAPMERQRLQGLLLEGTAGSGCYYLPDASWILTTPTTTSGTNQHHHHDGADDEWDVFAYAKMSETERYRQSLVRAVHWLQRQVANSSSTTAEIWVVVDHDYENNANEDEKSAQKFFDLDDDGDDDHLAQRAKARCRTMDELVRACCTATDSGTTTTTDHHQLEALLELKQACEEEYRKRNAPKKKAAPTNRDVFQDDHDDDESWWSDGDLQAGLKAGTLLRGRLNVSKDNVAEGYVTVGNNTTYFIDRQYFRRAFHQDMVILQVLPEGRWGRPVGRRRLVHQSRQDDDDDGDATAAAINDQGDPVPSARIVGLHAEGRRVFAATLLSTQDADENAVLVVPMDVRIPKIRIKTKTSHRLVGMRLKVRVTDWDVDSRYPHGQCLAVLGPIGELETEIQALLIENQVELEPFTVPALSCLPVQGASWRVQDDRDLVGRRDLRMSRRIFSVDPPGCQDIDDSMHAQVLPNGDIEIGVHIADVTYFVAHDSPLDREAQARGTTFYLVDRRFDMLPSLLSSDLCSLHGGIDRLAVSAVWVLSRDFKQVKSVWFGRTVIHNCAAMTYDQADRILQGLTPEQSDFKHPPALTAGGPVDPTLIPALRQDLTILTNLARFMRQQREDFGAAVDLTSSESGSELKFVLDQHGVPQKVKAKEDKEIHHTIAELMIMANTDVAKQIYRAYPTAALLRIHRSVEESRIEDLKEVLGAAGISLTGTDGKSLAEALRQAKAKSGNTPYQSLLLSVATRAMTEAQYVCTGELAGADMRHYGLGLDFYTHFTSPIRRYADVIVHKQLLASLQQHQQEASGIAAASLPKLVVIDPLAAIPESNVISVLGGEGIADRASSGGLASFGESEDIDGLIDAMTSGASSLLIGDAVAAQQSVGNTDTKSKPMIPYDPNEVSTICEGLNLHNRLAKQSSFECQALFLSLYFKEHEEIVAAVVTTIRDNGFFAYIPKFDLRGPVYVRDIAGVVQMDPRLLGLADDAGTAPSAGFRPPTRSLPGATTHLLDEDDKDRLEISLSNGRSIAHTIRPMDVVTVRLTCDDWDVRARVPQPRLHLIHGAVVESKSRTIEAGKGHNVVQIDSSILSPWPAIDPNVQRPVTNNSNNNETEYSLFNVLSELAIRPDLPPPPRLQVQPQQPPSSSVPSCQQTMRGRCIFADFINPHTKSATQEALQRAVYAAAAAAVEAKNATVTSGRAAPSYDAARSLEKSAWLRQQRLQAAKRQTKRSGRKGK